MRILAQCVIPDELANAWLQHLREFDAAHKGCSFEVMVQTGRSVPVREMVETLKVDPELSILEVFQRHGGELGKPIPAGPSQPPKPPFARAKGAVLAWPHLSDHAIAKRINVSHQTVGRARAALHGKTWRKQSKNSPNDRPGPNR